MPLQRLQTRPQFQAVLSGALIAKTEHFALHQCSLTVGPAPTLPAPSTTRLALFPASELWFGAMTPKRWARRAVTRNAIRRQIYSVSADFQHLFPPAAFVVRLRREFSRALFVSASSDALKAAVRAELCVLLQSGARSP